MNDTAQIICPYCGEQIEVYVDPETAGELVRDCDVCCRPWQLFVQRELDGELFVQAARAQ